MVDTPVGPDADTPSQNQRQTPPSRILRDTVNKRVVRILLECILVQDIFIQDKTYNGLVTKMYMALLRAI